MHPIKLPLDNPYALLASFLSPWDDDGTAEKLRAAARSRLLDWNQLLVQANLHFCTPLWYARLRQSGLLIELPMDLQEYLRVLHQANTERAFAFRQALRDLLQTMQEMNIPTLLLKGAATFCDDLYEDAGARMMGDLDILVDESDVERVRERLIRWGYTSLAQEDIVEFSPGYQPHHLPRMIKPGSPVALEIHFKVERGHAGRVLPTEMMWRTSETVEFEGLKTNIPNPTCRLVHNAVHAMVPQREFILSNLSLLQLAEFAALAHRYARQIDWQQWYERGVAQNLKNEFVAYLTLATRLMRVPWPQCVPSSAVAQMHAQRILLAGKYPGSSTKSPAKLGDRFQRSFVSLGIGLFYNLYRIPWIWRNVCYVEGDPGASWRFLLKKFFASMRIRLPEKVLREH